MENIGRNELTLDEWEIEHLAKQILWGHTDRIGLHFQSKANRDAVAKAARSLGVKNLRRSTTGFCLLDPRYTVEGSHLPDLGLANDYRHGFGQLYTIEPTIF